MKEANDGSQVKEEEEAAVDADLHIYEAVKLLRKCLIEHSDSHVDQFPVMRKLLKRLGKKRPSLVRFAEYVA